jgi:membrane protein implicated in regulation of membrane protease activity
MPLARFVLIVVLVIVAAGVTVALGALLAATVQVPALGFAAAIPAALIAYVVVRVVLDRVRSPEDRRYDRIER